MGRLQTALAEEDLKASAPAKKTTTKKKAKTEEFIPSITKDDRIKLITQDKIDLLDHPATHKYYIGGKDGGKTRSAAVDIVTSINSDDTAQCLALKKYKGNGERLHTSYQNIALEMKMLGFPVKQLTYNTQKGSSGMKTGRGRFAKVIKKIEYASFEDANKLAGIEAEGLGYFSHVHIEEPVEANDAGAPPTDIEWRTSIKMIKQSIARSNRKYETLTGNPAPMTKWLYTMNPWDEHPIIVEAEKHYPEKEFLDWVLEDYLNNNTRAKYNIDKDSLYIRTTTLANVIIRNIEKTLKLHKIKGLYDWNKYDKTKIDFTIPELVELGITERVVEGHIKAYDGMAIWFQVEEAIRTQDSLAMASLLGMKFNGTQAIKKTYDLTNLKKCDSDDIISDPMHKIKGISIGWDVDFRQGRGFWGTPIYLIENWETGEEAVVVGKQLFIPTYGDNANIKPFYQQELVKANLQLNTKIDNLAGEDPVRMKFMYVDENKYDLILTLRESMNKTKFMIQKASKHGSFDIENRQRLLQFAIDSGKFYIDEDNTDLINDLKKSIIKEGSKKRDESGRREKDYDKINSLEYGFYPMRAVAYNVNVPAIKWKDVTYGNK